MNNQLLVLILFSAIIYYTGCIDDEPKPPIPVPTPCSILYPSNNSTVDTSVFNFQWCAIEGATKYHIQADTSMDMMEFIFDTIVEATSVKSVIRIPVINSPNTFSEWSPFYWGRAIKWRVAPIINDEEGEWSEVYTFNTWDARDNIVGVYNVNKYIYKYNAWDIPYRDSSLGTSQIQFTKVDNSRDIIVTEIGGHNLTKQLKNQRKANHWIITDDFYPNYALFDMPNDSFEVVIMTNPADATPWGYYFGGFK